MMLTKKDIFDNQIKQCLFGNYHLVNKQTCSDKYAMPLLEEISNALK
jgi:hypothetical protein